MKKLIVSLALTALAVVSGLSQATVNFHNAISGAVLSRVYGLEPGNPLEEKHGNPQNGTPSGSQTYGGPLLAGTGYTIQLWGSGGTNVLEAALQVLATTSFRTGAAAGILNIALLPGGSSAVPVPNAPFYTYPFSGTFQVRAWDNQGGIITTWGQVLMNPAVARGASEVFMAGPLGGTGTPASSTPNLNALRSFNLHLATSLPVLSISDSIAAEGSNGTATAVFTVTQSPASANVVTVNFATADGTAFAGSDYVATSGTLTFQPGETNKTISVALIPDAAPEPDETFTMTLSSPVNADITRSTATALITDLTIEQITVDVAVKFHTVAGHVYALEKNDMSMTNQWVSVPGATNIAGTGGTVTAYDRGLGCLATQIYRARLVQ